jgi:uncharacterized damage-inducible protein DinB
MKRLLSGSGLAVLLLGLLGAPARAQGAANVSGVRAEILYWIQDAETKLVQLAEAIPAETYTWRPGEGVRSVSEVFLHVAASNYSIPPAVGVQPPADFAPQGFERSTTDKAKIVEHLKNSFAHVKKVVEGVSDADLDKTVRLFGRDSTYRNVLFLLATHAHEHLGQMIAYARSNGVVPPWTAARQAQSSPRP